MYSRWRKDYYSDMPRENKQEPQRDKRMMIKELMESEYVVMRRERFSIETLNAMRWR